MCHVWKSIKKKKWGRNSNAKDLLTKSCTCGMIFSVKMIFHSSVNGIDFWWYYSVCVIFKNVPEVWNNNQVIFIFDNIVVNYFTAQTLINLKNIW